MRTKTKKRRKLQMIKNKMITNNRNNTKNSNKQKKHKKQIVKQNEKH